MTLLTPLAAAAAAAALLPVAAIALACRRTAAVRRALGLTPPGSWRQLVAAALAAGGVALLALAAAQPALPRGSTVAVRRGVQAVFVVDVSRSMAAAAAPGAPTRLDRALAAAVRLRAAIPGVESGLLTLTDRALPDLLPVADPGAFTAVAERVVRIESPPPLGHALRATSYDALSQLATGNVFAPGVRRRLVVLLTDGESTPVHLAAVARALAPSRGYRLLALRFWRAGESVYRPDGIPEAAYRPDPAGRGTLRTLAVAVGGKSFEEGELGAAASFLRTRAGAGPTRSVAVAASVRTRLSPYVAALGLAALLGALGTVSLAWPSLPSATR